MSQSDTALIEQMYRDYWRYMISKDVEGLRSLMAKDYILHHMTGVKQSAEVFLSGLTEGTFNYYSAEHEDIQVSVHDNQASLTGKSRVLAAVYGGGKHLCRLRGDFTLWKEPGGWKFASSRASTY